MIDVKLTRSSGWQTCLTCDNVILDFDVHGIDEQDGAPRFRLCANCMTDLRFRLKLRAAAMREEAAWIESLADETWALPTEAEIAEAQAAPVPWPPFEPATN